MSNQYDIDVEIAWCPGCGNYSLLKIWKNVFSDLELEQTKIVIASGIGQAAKIPQYLKISYYNGLHGRSLPVATAIKAANPELTVIAESGDGDMYGEGGNHFLHCVRRNPDLVHVVHNNQIYGLTKGQASPTTSRGHKTTLQTEGVFLKPINPLALAITLGATFVARAFTGEMEKTKEIIKAAVKHRGYALVDIFDPCISFNKINTFKWYKENTRWLEQGYDNSDKMTALKTAFEENPYPLGILYQTEPGKSFSQNLTAYQENQQPLFERKVDFNRVKKLFIKD
jgi:2-oxoglutarate ferredoxin oxidoreductase subunit beta